MAREAPRRLLISVRPRFARGIMSGEKQVELRRVRPDLSEGDEVILYETSPTCAVVAKGKVAELLEASPARLWLLVGKDSGVARHEFMAYFEGRSRAYGIRLTAVEALESPVGLQKLRRLAPGFAPPQSYHYLRAERQRDCRLVSSL